MSRENYYSMPIPGLQGFFCKFAAFFGLRAARCAGGRGNAQKLKNWDEKFEILAGLFSGAENKE